MSAIGRLTTGFEHDHAVCRVRRPLHDVVGDPDVTVGIEHEIAWTAERTELLAIRIDSAGGVEFHCQGEGVEAHELVRRVRSVLCRQVRLEHSGPVSRREQRLHVRRRVARDVEDGLPRGRGPCSAGWRGE